MVYVLTYIVIQLYRDSRPLAPSTVIYWIYSVPDNFESIDLLVQKKLKIDFQAGGHLRFPIWTISVIFKNWSTSHLDTSMVAAILDLRSEQF